MKTGFAVGVLSKNSIVNHIALMETDRTVLKQKVINLVSEQKDLDNIVKVLDSTIKENSGFFSLFSGSRLRGGLATLSTSLKIYMEGEEKRELELKRVEQYIKDDQQIDMVIRKICMKTASSLDLETLQVIAKAFVKYLEDNSEVKVSFNRLAQLRFSQFIRMGCATLNLNVDEFVSESCDTSNLDLNISKTSDSEELEKLAQEKLVLKKLAELLNSNRRFTYTEFKFNMPEEEFLSSLCDWFHEYRKGTAQHTSTDRARVCAGYMIAEVLKKYDERSPEFSWLTRKIQSLANIPGSLDNDGLARLIEFGKAVIQNEEKEKQLEDKAGTGMRLAT